MQRAILAVLLALALPACAESFGEPASGFSSGAIAKAYIPLSHRGFLGNVDAAATQVADGVAATNAHNYELIVPSHYIGPVNGYDLIFFKSDGPAPPPVATPYNGERVRAYGQGIDGELRTAEGSVISVNATLPPRACAACAPQSAIIYDAPAGPGFSGGPVIDEKTGALVGITFGYEEKENGKTMMFAYDVNLVLKELAKLRGGG